jgi:hypothetical protein
MEGSEVFLYVFNIFLSIPSLLVFFYVQQLEKSLLYRQYLQSTFRRTRYEYLHIIITQPLNIYLLSYCTSNRHHTKIKTIVGPKYHFR